MWDPSSSPGEEVSSTAPTLAEIEEARALALKALNAAPKSRAQLAEKLAGAEIREDVVASLLDRFEAVGLIDDAGLAAMIVRTRFAERGQSRRAIAQELSRKGFTAAIAQDALAQIEDHAEWAAALDLARSKLRRTQGLGHEVRIRRTLGMLGRKGYSADIALRAIRGALEELSDDFQADQLGEVDGHVDDAP